MRYPAPAEPAAGSWPSAARFAAMEAAHDNVGKKLQALRLDASQARQEEVTTELLDLVIGQQAVDGPPV